MKNILIINGYLETGGAERVLVYLANHLCEKYHVSFAILQESKNELFTLDERVDLIQLRLEKERLSAKAMGLFGAAKYYINTAKRIKELAHELNTNLVIAFNDREVFLSWFAFHADPKIKLLFSQRSSPSGKTWHINFVLKYIYRHSDAVVFQLQQVEDFYGPSKSSKYQIIENPIKLLEKIEYFNDRDKLIIAAGRLNKAKRFDLLINSFSCFHKEYPEYRLIIYGDGVERDPLSSLITTLGLEDCVQLHGSIPNVMRENRSAEMFVLSSDFEGIPNVLIEAMAFGIPCISTDCDPGGGNMVTNHGRCAILVPRDDKEALYNAMKKYCTDKQLQIDNVKKAHEYIKRFDENKIYEKWDALISDLVI